MESGTTILLAGTKRGLFLFSCADRGADRRAWTSHGPILTGGQVYNAVLDQRGDAPPRLFAADNHDIYGATIKFSDDLGATWREPSKPIQFPEASGLSLENIWIVQPGLPDQPDTLYAGVDPASLWVTRDRGETWEANEALLTHPTRSQWMPGLGGMCLHSIVAHPTDPLAMWVAASAIGVLGTKDGGNSWRFLNTGVPARHMPNEYPEFGQCVHRLHVDPANPQRLVQQNHWGLFQSLDEGESWQDMQSNLPSFFGFPMALDPHNPATVYAVPQVMEGRHNVDDQFAVWRTSNAGGDWERLTNGLPSGKHVRLGVLRHGMCADDAPECGIYVGTNTGQLYASPDRGDHWVTVADHLPPIYSVSAAIL